MTLSDPMTYLYVGELSVFCVGPQSLAPCSLTDHHNGRVSLLVSPLETGKHLLHVKFSATHVPGMHTITSQHLLIIYTVAQSPILCT